MARQPGIIATRCLIAVAGLALATATAAQPAASAAAASPAYVLDPTHTAVHWEVVHMGTSTIRGRFDRLAGTLQFDAKAHLLEVGITVQTTSVNSGVALLDTILRGKELLDPTGSPEAYYTARQVRWEGDIPREIRGELTLRGTSEPLTLTATRWRCALSLVVRHEVCGGDFEGEIVRSRYGITHSLPFVDDRVKLLIEVEAVRQ